MKRFLAVLFAAVLVTLVVTSIASAHRGQRIAPTLARIAMHHHHAFV